MDDAFERVISELQRVESQFRRNGFDKAMGKDSHLFLALANTLINAVDDLHGIKARQNSVIAKEVREQVAEIERKMKGILQREQAALEVIRTEIEKDKPIVSQTIKKVRKTRVTGAPDS